nr:3549_t:CDS:2 [Entrophospora candida]
MDSKVVLLIDNAGSHFNPKQLEQSNENSTIVNDHNEEIIIINEESSSCSDNEEPIAESSQLSQRRKPTLVKHKKKKGRKTPNINLMNIRLIYIPPNTTAHLQPMDAGIIHSFKAKYKHEYCKYLIRHFDNGTYNQRDKLNVKEAIYFIAEAWNDVTETTIQNCWIKTGILPNKYLNDEEIISLVQFEEMGENGNDSSLDEEIHLIPVKNAINGIVKLMEPKIQKSIYAYLEKKEC